MRSAAAGSTLLVKDAARGAETLFVPAVPALPAFG